LNSTQTIGLALVKKIMRDNTQENAVSIQPWEHPELKNRFWVMLVGVAIVLSCMPTFFQYIQGRKGVLLDDWLLSAIPSINFSMPIFISMHLLSIYGIYRSWHNSWVFFRYGVAYIILNLLRAILILSFPLEPPKGLVSLVDPFCSFFYGGIEVTRDLMFSGHTSSMFLIFLVMDCVKGRVIALAVSLAVGCMLLFQHIHYTIDVLVAFPATYFCYWLSGFYIKADENSK
jgi:hypothetical protein